MFALSFYIYFLNYYIIRITEKYMGKPQGPIYADEGGITAGVTVHTMLTYLV